VCVRYGCVKEVCGVCVCVCVSDVCLGVMCVCVCVCVLFGFRFAEMGVVVLLACLVCVL